MNREDLSFQFGSVASLAAALVMAFISVYLSLNYRVPSVPSAAYIPSRYSVPNTYDVPAPTISTYPNSWQAAVTSILESHFRHQAIMRGVFNLSQYLPFNSSDLASFFESACQSSESRPCQLLKTSFPATAFHLLLSSFPQFPLHPQNSTTVVNFSMKQPAFAQTVQEIKSLIYTLKRPLLFSMPSIYADYGTQHFPSLLANGQFYVPISPAAPSVGDQLSVVLFGYSDDFVPASSIHRFKSHHLPKGGFIALGNLGSHRGDSIAYYEGIEDTYKEVQICPNFDHPANWPSNFPLDCIDSDKCMTEETYQLISSSNLTQEAVVNEKLSGLTSTVFVANKSGTVTFDRLPFWRLFDTFKLQFDWEASTSCGFWFIPYELVEMAASMTPPGLSGVVAMDLPVKFQVSSFNGKKLDLRGLRYH